MDPNFAYAHWVLGLVYIQKPALGDAIAELRKAVALEESNPRYMASLGLAYATTGKRSEASKITSSLQELSRRSYVPPTSGAGILAAAMDERKDEVIEAYERGYEDRSWSMCYLKVIVQLDPFRSDPRFQALLRRMNFPEK